MPDNDMYTVMQRALETIERAFGKDIFERPDKFRSALYDVKIDNNAKRIRNLLFIAVCDLKVYSRLKNAVASDYIFVVDNIAGEMFSDYMIDRDVSRSVIECIAVPLGYKPPVKPSPEPLKPSPLQPIPETPPAPVVSRVRQPATMPNQSYGISIKPKVGSIIPFGGYDWRVLTVENNKALLISEKILEVRPYNIKDEDITWENCTLRKYLNNEFYNKLGAAKSAVAETRNVNPGNPWYWHWHGNGNSTTDKVFLLSLDELVKYFGDSGDLRNKRRKNYKGNNDSDGHCVHDQYNSTRIANFGNKGVWWWWLRSPGHPGDSAAGVSDVGVVYVYGSRVFLGSGGVRPALWLNL